MQPNRYKLFRTCSGGTRSLQSDGGTNMHPTRKNCFGKPDDLCLDTWHGTFHVTNKNKLKVHCPEKYRIYAKRVEDNIPIFQIKMFISRVGEKRTQATCKSTGCKKLKDKYLTEYSKKETKQSEIHQIDKMITTRTPTIIQQRQQKRITPQLA